MHVLLLPSWYPNKKFRQKSGTFYKDQANALAEVVQKIGVIAALHIPIKHFLKAKDFKLSLESGSISDVNTYLILFPTISKIPPVTNKFKLEIGKYMFKKYISKHGKPDLIHVHSFETGILARWIKRKYNINYVVTEHSTGFERNIYKLVQLKLAAAVYKNSSCNIAVSKIFSEYLSNKFKEKFIYIPNLVNTDFFIPAKLSSEKKEFTFLNVAYLAKKKNQEMLIKAFSCAFKAQENIKLIIAGEGEEREGLFKLIKNLSLEKQIQLYGYASPQEVRTLLQSADRFILTSRFETFGVVLIEAMSCGIPVISTKSGGPQTIITSPELGELCELNELSIRKAMIKSFENKYDQDKIRSYAIENYSKKEVTTRLVELYKKFI